MLGVGAGAFMFSVINENQLRIYYWHNGIGIFIQRIFINTSPKNQGHLMAQKFGYIFGFLSGVSSILCSCGLTTIKIFIYYQEA